MVNMPPSSHPEVKFIKIRKNCMVIDLFCMLKSANIFMTVVYISDGRDQDLEVETETETFILGLMGSRPRPRLLV